MWRHETRGTRVDDAEAGLVAAAKQGLVEQWTEVRWDYWVRLKWNKNIGAETADTHLNRLLADLHRTVSPAIHLVGGFHREPMPHAHAVVVLTRRTRLRFMNATEFRDWLQLYWYHGPVWAERFDPMRREPEHGGALAYLAREPGTVVWG